MLAIFYLLAHAQKKKKIKNKDITEHRQDVDILTLEGSINLLLLFCYSKCSTVLLNFYLQRRKL